MRSLRYWCTAPCCVGLLLLAGCSRAGTTQVLVIGTIHQQHESNPNYSYHDLVRILSTYDPDLVCVEIRPQDFRRRPYLREMMLATVWGLAHGRDVCAMDSWSEADSTRQVRARLQKEREYIQKAQTLDSLEASSVPMSSFQAKYGDFWNADMGYRFFNGSEYNAYIAEAYRLSMGVYGDSPMNLHYRTRNSRMMELILKAMHEFAPRKLVVLTGVEHKHFFDRELENHHDVALVQLEEILPLEEQGFHAAIHGFLDEDDDLPYYADGYPEDLEAYYANKLTRLLHGPNMDWRPEIIPSENVRMAGRVIGRWGDAMSESPRLLFEAGWHACLTGDYEAGIGHLSTLTHSVDRGDVDDLFVRVYAYRNLGLCYDMAGRREDAIRSYARVAELVRGTTMEKNKERMLRDYLRVPYRRAEGAGQ